MEDLETIKLRLVSIVRPSSEALSVKEVFTRYRHKYNNEVPFLKFGYSNVEELLRDVQLIVLDSNAEGNRYIYKNISYPASPESMGDSSDNLVDSLLVGLGSSRENNSMPLFHRIVCTPKTVSTISPVSPSISPRDAGTLTDLTVLARRTQDIEKAKDKPVYAHYKAKFPSGGPLSTPKKEKNCSRRSWDQQVRIWKKSLYEASGFDHEQKGGQKRRQFDTAENLAKKRLDVLGLKRPETKIGEEKLVHSDEHMI